MTLSYDLYWSFRSPYSYLVTAHLVALERDFVVRCNVRIVYPIAVRQADFFAKLDPLWFSYFMRDIYRCADIRRGNLPAERADVGKAPVVGEGDCPDEGN